MENYYKNKPIFLKQRQLLILIKFYFDVPESVFDKNRFHLPTHLQ